MSWHPMRPRDVKPCVDFLATFDEECWRYDVALEKLPAAWMALLRNGSMNSAVHEEPAHKPPRVVGLGVSVFVTDDLLVELKTPPLSWIGPELVRRFIARDRRILSSKEIREANSWEGLNMVVWTGRDGPLHPEDQAALRMEMLHSFIFTHSGFKMKEHLVQPINTELISLCINSGVSFWNAETLQYVANSPLPQDDDAIREPFLLGCTCNSTMGRMGIFNSMVYCHTPPKLYFRPAEQRLLLAALRGFTDEQLSDELTISLTAVKKTWRQIYERAAEILPNGDHSPGELNSKRGKQKKHQLLSYLRDHMQELRPVLPPKEEKRAA